MHAPIATSSYSSTGAPRAAAGLPASTRLRMQPDARRRMFLCKCASPTASLMLLSTLTACSCGQLKSAAVAGTCYNRLYQASGYCERGHAHAPHAEGQPVPPVLVICIERHFNVTQLPQHVVYSHAPVVSALACWCGLGKC